MAPSIRIPQTWFPYSGFGTVRTLLALLSLLLLLGGCAGSVQHRDDPLLERRFDSRSGEELSREAVLARAATADVIYLGENHDNARHHQLQLEIISALLERGIRPAIGFEFFDTGQTSLLTQYVAGSRSSLKLSTSGNKISPEQKLRRQLGWEHRDDEYWGFYFRLIDLAREHQLDIFGADLPAGTRTRLSRIGVTGLNPLELEQLVPTGLEDEAYRQLMYRKFRDGHCGWGEEPLLSRLYQTWLARNDRMALSVERMLADKPVRPVVMILGNGHIEHNMGVYERVAHLRPALTQLSLGFRQIAREATPLQLYLEGETIAGRDFGPAFEVFWFTPRQSYDDPCEGFRKS